MAPNPLDSCAKHRPEWYPGVGAEQPGHGVFATGVYAQKGQQDQLNAADQIFNQSGVATLLSVTQEGDAYKATFPIAVQLI